MDSNKEKLIIILFLVQFVNISVKRVVILLKTVDFEKTN